MDHPLTVTLSKNRQPVIDLQATNAHDALHHAMNLIGALSEHADAAMSTMHALNGDPTAWAMVADREVFVDCAMTDSTGADLITRD